MPNVWLVQGFKFFSALLCRILYFSEVGFLLIILFVHTADQFVLDLDTNQNVGTLQYTCTYDGDTDTTAWKRMDPISGERVTEIPMCLSQCIQDPYIRTDLVKTYDGSVN